MSSTILTSSQTVGPFFHDCLLREDAQRNRLSDDDTSGERIRVEGRILDGDGLAIPDAVLEVWQANQHGRYNHPADQRELPLDPGFLGYGRFGTDADGWYWFETIRPGCVPFDTQRMQASHICVALFGRGLLNHLFTRIYFADDPQVATDPMLELVPQKRRATLLASPSQVDVDGALVYRFDIVVQGTDETVFFNL